MVWKLLVSETYTYMKVGVRKNILDGRPDFEITMKEGRLK